MIVVVMGVAGCGKTTVGRALADRLSCRFIDADDHHPPANREKLRRDIPLGDEDRAPWLAALAELLRRQVPARGVAVMGCSALKEKYREALRACGHPMVFVHLAGSRGAIAERLRARAGEHALVERFDRILEGQFRDLEPPNDAICVDCDLPVAEIVDQVASELGF